jgi:hypothetical protein
MQHFSVPLCLTGIDSEHFLFIFTQMNDAKQALETILRLVFSYYFQK